MINIENILDDIHEYKDDVESLVRQLKSLGIHNLEGFLDAARESGANIPKSIKDAIEEKFSNSDINDWTAARNANTEEAYLQYLNANANGNYRAEARAALQRLQEEASINQADAAWDDLDKSDLSAIEEFLKNNPKSNKFEEALGIIWEDIDKNSQDALNGFISDFPNNPFATEALTLIKELKKQQYLGMGITALERQMKDIQTDKRINNPEKATYEKIVNFLANKWISIDDLMMAIKKDHNFISSTVANLLWENGIVNDFAQADIDPDFMTAMMSGITATQLPVSSKLERISKVPCTEVYFWGIPSSGKSCALGAILSAANNGKIALSMAKNNNCQGYQYMTRLANLFNVNGSIGALPEGTAVTSTYEMSFDLEDLDRKVHPITCIDLAGELVRCMFKKDAGQQLNDEEEAVLNTLTDVMVGNRTNNRKIHFFVIEYGAENRLYEGLPQRDYLDAAVRYIESTGIFRKDTDGLYLLISKVDKAQAHGKDLKDKLTEYIERNYLSFYNGLAKICRDNEINGGIVDIIPFTLGEVCFQNFCKFKDKAAVKVVETILKRAPGYKPGRLNRLFNAIRK